MSIICKNDSVNIYPISYNDKHIYSDIFVPMGIAIQILIPIGFQLLKIIMYL